MPTLQEAEALFLDCIDAYVEPHAEMRVVLEELYRLRQDLAFARASADAYWKAWKHQEYAVPWPKLPNPSNWSPGPRGNNEDEE